MSETVRFGLTVPTDRRFHEMVRAFSVRVAAYLGYADGEAEAIGQTDRRAGDRRRDGARARGRAARARPRQRREGRQ